MLLYSSWLPPTRCLLTAAASCTLPSHICSYILYAACSLQLPPACCVTVAAPARCIHSARCLLHADLPQLPPICCSTAAATARCLHTTLCLLHNALLQCSSSIPAAAATTCSSLSLISNPCGNPSLLLPAVHHRRSSTCSSPPPPLQHMYPCSSPPLLLHLQLTTAAIPATIPQLQRHCLSSVCCLICSSAANHCCCCSICILAAHHRCCSICTRGAHHCCSRSSPLPLHPHSCSSPPAQTLLLLPQPASCILHLLYYRHLLQCHCIFSAAAPCPKITVSSSLLLPSCSSTVISLPLPPSVLLSPAVSLSSPCCCSPAATPL